MIFPGAHAGSEISTSRSRSTRGYAIDDNRRYRVLSSDEVLRLTVSEWLRPRQRIRRASMRIERFQCLASRSAASGEASFYGHEP